MNFSIIFKCVLCVLYVTVLSPELEELLVEGLLLQVTLPELQHLYQGLLSSAFPSQHALQSSEHDHQYHITQDTSLTYKSPPQNMVQVSPHVFSYFKEKPKPLQRNIIYADCIFCRISF